MRLLAFAKKHRFISAIAILQMVFLLALLISCFGKTFEAQIGIDNLYEGEGYIEHSDNDMAIGVYREYNAGAKLDILLTDYFNLKAGAYEIAVDYFVVRDYTAPEYSQPNFIGTVDIHSDQRELIRYQELGLDDGGTHVETRFWISYPFTVKDFELVVKYHAVGDLFIRGISVRELAVWRISRLLIWLVVFAAIDGFFWLLLLRKRITGKERLAWIVGILCVGFASLPLFGTKLIVGDDLFYHIGRFVYLGDSLFAGQFPVRMHFGVSNGYGYPSPLFYGELSLYFPAILYRMAFPVQTCLQLYMIAINIATYLIAFHCFRKMSQSIRISATGACLYTLAIYRLVCMYERSALGEYTAMAFLPLILYGIWKLYEARDDQKLGLPIYGPLVFGFSALIQSHLLTTFMCGFLVVLFCLVQWRKTFKPRRLLALLKVVVWVIAINLWFLLPLVDSMSMPLIINCGDSPYTAYQTITEPIYLLGGLGQEYGLLSYNYQYSFSLGIALIVGLAIYLAAACMRDRWELVDEKSYKIAGLAFYFGVLSLWMCTQYFPWRVINTIDNAIAEYFTMIQFPWRYLSFATLFASVTAVMTLNALRLKNQLNWMTRMIIVLLTLAVLASGTMLALAPSKRKSETYDSKNLVRSYNVGNGEYFLAYTDTNVAVLDGVPGVSSDDITIERYETVGNVRRLSLVNNGAESAVQFPVFRYDNYHAYDAKTHEELILLTGKNNTVEVVVPEGYEGTIELRYVSPALWRVAEAISLLAIIVCLAWYFAKERRIIRRTKELNKSPAT